ncbi:MAG TPA: PSD1 and planctomycete cytochrome C domain-containing protein, partial [Gemmataceae bacterium]|nr:PSD1 and planctomycete cytochrome C domain-containing protein [Gemmataceae bacterium]
MQRQSLLIAALLFTCTSASFAQDKKSAINFDRDIRPILSNNCYVCHGFDEGQRKAKLRLDTRDGAIAKLRSGGHAIVPGKADASEFVRRIFSDDENERMPPTKSNKKLTTEQKDLLKRWINEGAPYAQHWAFVAPKRPMLPAVKRGDWARTPIDRFILARLEKEGLQPSPEAERTTLIRRLAFDLTGLPPTVSEIDAFLKDARPDAYERLVERYLSSPHYGERLAVDWLDAARYADTHGYHIDAGRDMSRWREWVIDSFNRDLPFDRFTIEQLAGDLLPNATIEQKIASGFNRNHMINFEGGAIPEEYLNNYIVDRVNTTATVWLGLTMTCSQCHDHKYDPITQREYYQLYAYFNNIPENGLDGSRGNAAPLIKAPSRKQLDAIADLEIRIKSLEAKLLDASPMLDAEQAAWEKSALQSGAIAWKTLDVSEMKSAGGATLKKQADGSILASGVNPATETYNVRAAMSLPKLTAIRVEALPDASFAGNGPGRSVNGNFVMTNIAATIGTSKIAFTKASASFEQKDFPVRNAIDASSASGWGIHPNMGKPSEAVFSFAPLQPKDGEALTVRFEFKSPHGQHQVGRFRVSVTDAPNPHGKSSIPANIVAILQTKNRSDAQKQELARYYRSDIAGGSKEIAALRAEKAKLESQGATTMVMQELAKPRDTFMLMRGEYNKKGARVSAGVPAFLPALPKDAPNNRLGLAKWLTDPSHPLMSRVIVNRYWQLIFGTGIVKTVEDFGSQGEAPSHPELLDWLAVEFMQPTTDGAKAWSVRDLLRLIVTSSAYRQSSVVTKQHLARDPENRLLARGPRFRLQAEFIRDQALAVSGLLNRDIGGASVSPYQPSGLWQELAAR